MDRSDQDCSRRYPPISINHDWPNPRAPIYPVSLRTWIDQTKLALQPLPSIATLNYDFPNSRGPIYPVSLRTWSDQTRRQLIGEDEFFGLAGHPNFDWPNPVLLPWVDRYT